MDQSFMEAELTSAIKTSKKNTARGLDGIILGMIHNPPTRELQELLTLYNKIWEICTIPTD